jgi:hypothetical protein
MVDEARGLVRNVFDVGEGLSWNLLSAIYRLVFLIAALPWVVFTVLAFERSTVVWGLVWGLVLGPALYVVLVTGMRIALGFAVVLLRLGTELTELPAAVDRLTAEVGNLRGDIGRLPDAVEDLNRHIRELPEVVTTLNEHIDSLQGSLDRAQFWRAPARRLRSSRYRDDDPVPQEGASAD